MSSIPNNWILRLKDKGKIQERDEQTALQTPLYLDEFASTSSLLQP